MTATAHRHAPPGGRDDTGPGEARRRPLGIPGRVRRGALPYLLLLPALVFELIVHVIPMVVGVVMSLKELTQLYIREWWKAPWTGWGNYRVVVRVNAPIGHALLNSFLVTCAFTVLAVGLSWLLGTAAAILMQDSFRGRGVLRAVFLTPYALPLYASVIVWAFMFQHDNGLVNHVLHDQLHLTGKPTFWLLGNNSFIALVVVSVWRNWPFAFPSSSPGCRTSRASCTRRRRSTAPGSGSRSAASPCRRCARSTRCSSSCCSCGRSTTSPRRTCCSASRRPRPAT
jgi:multiple sugar transport system permease protein